MLATSIGNFFTFIIEQWRGELSMLSRDCDGCSKHKECSKRYQRAVKGDKVYCPDGTAHLIDDSSIILSHEFVCFLQSFQ